MHRMFFDTGEIRYNCIINMKYKNKSINEEGNLIKRNLPVIAAFVIPVIALIFIFAARDIYPFGENMYLRSDMYHQYATFLKEFQSILKSGDSLLYTWNIGLGTDFVGTYAYYLASPANWLVYFLPTDNIPEIMGGFIILKAGLMSATFAYYLKKHFGSSTYMITAFGMFYGMSSYMAAYSWNLMWLDCLVLLPLIVLGLERLVKEGRVTLYTVTLAVCVISNYYISIMICIFLVLYFIYLIICERHTREYYEIRAEKGKEAAVKLPGNIWGGGSVIRSAGRFAFYSLIAAGIACVLLIPTMYTMLGSASNSFNFPTAIRWYFNFFEMVSHAAMNVEPTVLSGYIPNIYCTIGVFMLIPLYLLCGKIRPAEKIGKAVLLGIFLVSFMCNVLNYIWHGFHYPNSLSARQSFIYIFLILIMAYEAMMNVRELSYWQLAGCFAAGGAMLFVLWYVYGDAESYPLSITVISVVFLTLYFVWCILKKAAKIPYVVMSALLVAIAVCEVCINTNETGYSTTSRTAYVSDNGDIDYLLDEIDDDGFYRVEKTKRRTKNDGAWSDYRSASLFSSSARASISDFYELMGMQSSMNSYSYYGHTLVTSAILGVKYELSTARINDIYMTEIASTDSMILYENKYALTLGFAVNSDLADSYSAVSLNPFEAQNKFIEDACGVSDVFTVFAQASGTAVSITVSVGGREYLYITDSLESAYVYVERDGEIIYEEEYTDLENPQIVEICDVEEGDIVTVSSTDTEVEEISVISAVLDYDLFEEAMDILSESQYNILEFSSAYITGTIYVSGDCYMFTTIPAEYGWKIYVDGVEVEAETYNDAFLMVALTAGDHVITFKYVPTALILGIIISALSIIIFVICMLNRYFIRKKRDALNTFEPDIFEEEAAAPPEEDDLFLEDEDLVL